MATQLSKETLDQLSQFLGWLGEFKKNPLDLSFYLEHSDVPRSTEEYRKILEGFRKAVEKRQVDAKHFSTVILKYNPKVLPFTEASREKAAKAVEEFADSLEHALQCMEYHLETGAFPPGMTSLKDCTSMIKGLDIINQYLTIGQQALTESRLHGKPSLTKYLTEIKEEEKTNKKDFWKDLKGKDFKTQLKTVVKNDPKLKGLDAVEPDDDSALEEKEDTGSGNEGDATERLYSRLIPTSKRYNVLLHGKGDIDHWIILGSVISTSYRMDKDTKTGGRSRDPKVYIKKTSDFLAVRNVPVLGIKSAHTPSSDMVRKAKADLMSMRKEKGRDPFFFQRTWAKYWSICSPAKYVNGYYYFVLWPTKFRGSRSDLRLNNWDFNKASTGKKMSLEVEKT